ncbi:hypothetical protein KP509_34G002900 [Ceratopteris richardii]|uniref:Uncharacterized protein n=1 Tax=Ceratopteris richardii TaxID=49495 RepID=A0A8T2QIJ9_CERRI|nr:hypothetical protein KP509_34G002900 [Ceratopteris richardii]
MAAEPSCRCSDFLISCSCQDTALMISSSMCLYWRELISLPPMRQFWRSRH